MLANFAISIGIPLLTLRHWIKSISFLKSKNVTKTPTLKKNTSLL